MSFKCILGWHKSPVPAAPVPHWYAGDSKGPLRCTRCNKRIAVHGDGSIMVFPGS